MCFSDNSLTYMEICGTNVFDGERKSFGTGECDARNGGAVIEGEGDTYKLAGATLKGFVNENVFHVEPTYRFAAFQSFQRESFAKSAVRSGDILKAKDGLESPNNMYRFKVQEDANLVIYDVYDNVKWARSDVAPEDCADPSTLQLRLENGGNLVLFCGDLIKWESGTGIPRDICRIVAMQNDGQLAMYNVAGQQSGVWSSGDSIPVGFGPSNLTSPHSLQLGQRLVQGYYGGSSSFVLSIESGRPVVNKWQDKAIWTAPASCEATDNAAYLHLQEDGDLVLYCDEAHIRVGWATNTADPSLEQLSGVNGLFLNADGSLVLINKRGQIKWTSGSGQEYEYKFES
ncbi:unnamed protein product [Durusdinium trenchii]|uniref:Bulb-type lectin domain-containing protein n=2 Tax=Durusdinium trenchii TaxID=1381693 RepID=A0ABP0LGR6_9DINO